MSLKAKLEAVIYASEEPVTLAQLSMLFADEALEWKAEQQAASESAKAEEVALPLEISEAQPEAEASENNTEENAGEAAPAAEVPEPPAEDGAEAAASENSSTEAAENGEASHENDEAQAEEPAIDEAETKRLARQREREARATIRQLLDELIAEYAADARGIEVREIAGGYRMATKAEFHDAVRAFVKSLKPPLKLSLPALETLAVIAYKQPVTAPEVNEIRGVESSGVFGSLLARKLIATAGRKQVIGRPILYKTTREFLLRFGLKDVSELPSMEEFEKMAASELEEPELAENEVSQKPADGETEKAAEAVNEAANEPTAEAEATDEPKAEAETANEAETGDVANSDDETKAGNEAASDTEAETAPDEPKVEAETEAISDGETQAAPAEAETVQSSAE
jgi:segregation and condensation protein B